MQRELNDELKKKLQSETKRYFKDSVNGARVAVFNMDIFGDEESKGLKNTESKALSFLTKKNFI